MRRFRNRVDAGRELAESLVEYAGRTDVICSGSLAAAFRWCTR
jgi:predicted phosphoribosyltransferase